MKKEFRFTMSQHIEGDSIWDSEVERDTSIRLVLDEGATWMEVHDEFLSWLGGVYGYDIRSQVFPEDDK